MTAAMISAMDDGIGAVLDEVDRSGIAGDTIVLFTSDNGPSREARDWLDGRTDRYYGGSAGGFRGYKFSLFEGGIRVPGIIRWPGRVAAGATCSLPATRLDVLPTVATAAAAPVPEGLDGCDILPVLGDAAEPGLAEALASRYLYGELGRQSAIRRGRWKLVLNGQDEEDTPPEGPWLSDLCEDPGERVNRAAVEEALCEEMAGATRTWRKRIEADWAADTGVTARGTVSPAEIGR